MCVCVCVCVCVSLLIMPGQGARGSLSELVMEKFDLRRNSDPPTYGIGLKEVIFYPFFFLSSFSFFFVFASRTSSMVFFVVVVPGCCCTCLEIWELAPGKSEPGSIIHAIGWPLGWDTYGGERPVSYMLMLVTWATLLIITLCLLGAFGYHMDNNRFLIGFGELHPLMLPNYPSLLSQFSLSSLSLLSLFSLFSLSSLSLSLSLSLSPFLYSLSIYLRDFIWTFFRWVFT